MKNLTIRLLVAAMLLAGSMASPALFAAEAKAQINEQRMLNDFLEYTKVRSQSTKERAFADVLKARLTKLGAEVSEDEAHKAFDGNTGNIFAYFKGSIQGAPVMMLNAHIDTVEPSEGVEPKIVDGVIRASGKTILGADDKSGVVAILEALTTLKEKSIPHADILVILTVAEERGMWGAKNINQAMLKKADFGISMDGSSETGGIFYNAPGANIMKITVEGRAAHAGQAPEKGLNAIMLASKAIADLKQGRLDEETTANVGTIQCGVATNVVPAKCELMAEARSRSKEKLERQTAYMKDAFIKAATDNGGKADVTVTPVMSAYLLEKDSLPVVAMSKAVARIGGTPQYKQSGGGTDANFFNAYGVPTAMVAVGGGANHTPEEYISVAELHKAGNLVLTLIQEAAQLKK